MKPSPSDSARFTASAHGGGDWNVVSLFAGIGGFELGLERAGMTPVASCEINPKCRHLLREHWPEVQQFDDVCTMRAADVPHRVRVICGGFPCQDISFAGKGAGLAGERSGLWREYARLIGEFRPDYVLVENVAALLGRGLGDVLGDLASLGYDAWWDCIPAAAVGAPHRRDRLWIVAYPRGQQHEGYGDALRREIAAGLSRSFAVAGWSVADADHGQCFGSIDPVRAGRLATCGGGEALADATSDGRHEGNQDGRGSRPRGREEQGAGPGRGSDEPALADTLGERGRRRHGERQDAVHAHPCGEAFGAGEDGGWWSAEPDVGRVAHGVPARVDRLHGLGNAVVPQIPEILGRAIIAAEAACRLEQAA